jgi:hypothetical protein
MRVRCDKVCFKLNSKRIPNLIAVLPPLLDLKELELASPALQSPGDNNVAHGRLFRAFCQYQSLIFLELGYRGKPGILYTFN